jgi:hypothetical protein
MAREGHRDGFISVWDSRTLEEICALSVMVVPYGFSSVAFSPCGRYLLAVATDVHQSLVVWSWREARVMGAYLWPLLLLLMRCALLRDSALYSCGAVLSHACYVM